MMIIGTSADTSGFALPELPPLETAEQTVLNPVEIDESIEQSVQIKPSSGEIEKNSFQEPYDRSDLKNEVVPKTHSEVLRVVMMFVKVMGAVLLCGGVIFLLLWLVKKYYYGNEIKNYGESALQANNGASESNGDLKSPQDENEALKNFLNQTKNH